MSDEKTCSRCGSRKPLGAFYCDAKRTGYFPYCKECAKRARQARDKAHRAIMQASAKHYQRTCRSVDASNAALKDRQDVGS